MKWYILFLIGALSVLSFRLYHHIQTSVPPIDREHVVSGLILDEPRVFRGEQTIKIKSIHIRLPKNPRLHYGDFVSVQGIVQEKRIEYEERSRIIYEIEDAQLISYERRKTFETIGYVQRRIKDVFQQSIDARQSDLMLGIVFGMTDSMDHKLYDELVSTGVLHVVSASGANISILATLALALLSPFMKRQIATLITMVIIAGYALIASLDPSIVRASIMAWLMLSATLLGRQHYALWAVIISAYVMVLIEPFLIEDVGFQLSFTATIGIITLKPLFDRSIAKRFHALVSDLTTTIAAQIMTLPILLYAFGSFSLISIIANAFILWMVAPLMVIGVIAGIASLIASPIAHVMLVGVYPVLTLFLMIVSFFSQYSYLLTVSTFPVMWVISYYFFTGGIILSMHQKRK